MDLLTLDKVHSGCLSNKRRSLDAVHYEIHRELNLVRCLDDVNDRSLDPFLYSFVKMRPQPREVVAALMQMKDIQYYYDFYIRPLIEQQLTTRTYNNRIGYGVDRALRQIMEDIYEMSDGYTRDCWVFTRDIRGFFPNMVLARVYEMHRALIEENFPPGELRDELLYIAMRVIYAYPQLHARVLSQPYEYQDIIAAGKSVVFNPDYNKGGCLGNQFWQAHGNFALADFDRYQVETCGLRYNRLTDDMTWTFADKEQGKYHMKVSERMMNDCGFQMHPTKRSCQHYSHGVHILGAVIKYDRIYVDDRTVRHCLDAIHRWNRLAYPSQLEHFLASINSYLGILKNRTAYGIIRDMVDEVSPKWLRYCHYDDDRRCFVANEGYTHNELLIDKYGFKFNNNKLKEENGNKRQNRQPGEQAA